MNNTSPAPQPLRAKYVAHALLADKLQPSAQRITDAIARSLGPAFGWEQRSVVRAAVLVQLVREASQQ